MRDAKAPEEEWVHGLRVIRQVIRQGVVDSDTPGWADLSTSRRIAQFGRQLIRFEEKLYVLFLGPRRQLSACGEVMHRGNDVVTVRAVFRAAFDHVAVEIVLCTLRSRGGITPSLRDHAITRATSCAGREVGVPVFDHVIVDPTEHYSFRDLGVLNGPEEHAP